MKAIGYMVGFRLWWYQDCAEFFRSERAGDWFRDYVYPVTFAVLERWSGDFAAGVIAGKDASFTHH